MHLKIHFGWLLLNTGFDETNRHQKERSRQNGVAPFRPPLWTALVAPHMLEDSVPEEMLLGQNTLRAFHFPFSHQPLKFSGLKHRHTHTHSDVLRLFPSTYRCSTVEPYCTELQCPS